MGRRAVAAVPMFRTSVVWLAFATIVWGDAGHGAWAAGTDTIVVDGQRDAAYVLLAEDPPGDLDLALSADPHFNWTDLTRLYVANDAQNLFVFADLPYYSRAESYGQFGLAIMTAAVVSPTSSLPDLWGLPIIMTYSRLAAGTCAAVPSAPQPPDVLIRGWIRGQAGVPPNENNGYSELFRWDGVQWQSWSTNWSGATTSANGERLAMADAGGLELSIPFTATGNITAETALRLEFFATARGSPLGPMVGAFDTVPTDAQASAAMTTTVQQALAVYAPPLDAPNSVGFGCGAVVAGEASGTVPITVTLGSPLSQTVTVTYTAGTGTAGLTDFVPLTGSLEFLPNKTQQAFSLQILDDTQVEPDEIVLLTLDAPLNAALGSRATATLTILDDDVAGPQYYVFVPLTRR